ncbi:ras GTPase-activating protein-binding protein 2 [Episyrphus balteatus]|uniref:ras GTPase-activating protein-binding protein 2 n=1 Tax=Episyrphus balteatus TaxID=286459 RepID=UPI0024867AE0|nr:ras GTPase-activating protein-binding protein 2 [Episyrphus balteatus]XP_055848472.1 ras GTPase-activating protein-binding protein 2 [Episyrphus balteatus]XP_055848473.1 ras GTPase-activating protein-binding protein 2 [Episyrphus balteatus]
MVMEEQQPSPQSVGREFVRQYYTLLNKAPSHLHRFYNNNSSFIHGESTLVVGQKNIHNRIQQLNFRDCHAKISQVDAQATLGNGVVVQVTGELSNDGQPMRRFTQTFVLAAQSPKKYYVHNDIFRYQDMYSDEENDGESRSENDEEHEIDPQQQQQPQVVPTNNLSGVTDTNVIQQVQPQQQQPTQQQQVVVPQPQAQQQAIYYSMPQTVVAGAPRAVPVIAAQAVPIAQFPAPTAAQQTQLNGGIVHEDLLATTMQQQTVQQQQPVQLPMQQMVPPVQANVAPAVVSVVSPQVIPQQPTQVAVVAAGAIPQVVAQIPSMPSAAVEQSPPLPVMGQTMPVISQVSSGPATNVQPADSGIMTANANTSGGSASQKDDDMGNYSDHASSQEYIDEPQMAPEKYEAPKNNEPKTYANLLKSANINPSSPGSGYVPLPPVNQNHMNMNQQSQQQSSLSSSSSVYKSESRMIDNNIQTGSSGPAPLPQRTNSTRINKDFEQRRPGGNTNTQQFSDSNQLFLGNVPHHATEDELKQLFNRFGAVMDLRIHSKPGPKVPGIRNPQNYGFITYQDSQSVENCLSHCPLFYPENSPDGQKLNVEEKKPRLRNPNDLPPRQSNNMSGNNGGNGNNMGNSQRPNMGPNRSLSNSGGMMRGNPGNNSLSRGTSGGPRMGGFNRNDSRGPPGSGSQSRGGNGNSGSNTGGGGQSYNRR